jgi:peptide chain release factor 2
LATSWCVFDVAGKEAEIARLEEASLAADFWSDPSSASPVMRRLTVLRADTARWRALEQRAAGLTELGEMIDPEVDPGMVEELSTEVDALSVDVDAAETVLLLAGEYDAHDAVLAIHAGAGGTESQDWVEMLQRMYLRWAERHGMEVDVVDVMPGEEAGIKSTTMAVRGPNAYGLLKSERGVHRLVRISPFDGAARRHTSFALVELSPVIDADVSIEVREEDLRVDVFRASGAGGQHVNKTSSAVRMVHLPTGVVVTCQNERSQAQNRATALSILRARLVELELERQETEQARLKGQHVEAGWGNQIRSYVLQPYQLVKDHRTGHEIGNTQAVLDGDLDGFIEAYLKHQIGAPRA